MKNSTYIISIAVLLFAFTGCEKSSIFRNEHKSNKSIKNHDVFYNIDEDIADIDNIHKTKGNYNKEYGGIVAFVNGDVITATALKERIDLALFAIGGKIDEKQMADLHSEILNEMIEEKLKKQCVTKFAPKGGWVSDQEISSRFEELAQRNNMDGKTFSQLLKSKNLKKEILLEQILVNLSWREYIRARFGKNIVVSDSELKRAVANMKQKMDDESFYVCRMFFPFSSSSEERSVLNHVNNLHQMLLRGADFASLSRQFSKSAGAQSGGDLSWIFDGQLPTEEMNALRNMVVGSYKVVRNNNGYAILHLKDKKGVGLRTYTNLKFVQVVVPFTEGYTPSADDLKHLMNYIYDLKKNAKNCHDFIAKAKESGILGVSDSISAISEMMQPQFRTLVEKTTIGGISDPIVMDKGVIVMCILDKKVDTVKVPTENEIKMARMDEQLTSLARAELNFLKRKSFIKVNGDVSQH